jgi:endoglucanase
MRGDATLMPRYGFNFLWMFSADFVRKASEPAGGALDFLAKYGFDFVRLPLDYRFWTRDFRYIEVDEGVLRLIDEYVEACRSRGIHVSINLHRAPGYCINRNDLERHNLWLDAEAQDAFIFLWKLFAERYRGLPGTALSFDLLNEPPGVGQFGLTRESHAALMRRTIAAIGAIDPDREIVIDGLGGGNQALPELSDAGAIHSGRGYQPMSLTHYQADWWDGGKGLPVPTYPGTEFNGYTWNAETIRGYYEPWRQVERTGTKIHIGEFGCFDRTPNDVALRWFTDLLGTYKEFGWGYALWQFEGPFGIVGHGRPDARFERLDGYSVDRDLLGLLVENKV